MGQKVHPHGFRVGIIKDWDSRWYAHPNKVGDLVVEDYRIREYLKKLLTNAGVPRIEIERDTTRVKVYIHCSRPGVIIGKGGAEIERIRGEIEKMISKPVSISIVEIKSPDTNAQLVAEGIAAKLEKRIGFRRAMKNAMSRAMRLGVRGIKVMVAGRLGGAEIARSETYHEGTIPLQTLRADIDYGFAEAATTYGRIGVKVWVYNGEILNQALRSTPRTLDLNRPQRERRDRDNRRDNRQGGSRQGGYQNNRDGSRQGGYQGNRQGGQGTGYQGNRDGNRPAAGTGYQGNRDAARPGGGGYQSGGYQGNRQGGGGYQAGRQGTGTGYQGNRQGGYQGNRDGNRPPYQGNTPAQRPAAPVTPPASDTPKSAPEGGTE